ncbi:protein-methionine-sulfoxide reductase heme-binding subunit MsrQ [Arenibacterium sp. CAU 1754]
MSDLINRIARKTPPWPLYILGAGYAGWLFYLALVGRMGAEPIKALEHAYGETGLKLLILGLTITPLRRFFGLNLIKFRRAVGLVTFLFISAHLCVWLFLDVQALDRIWADILKRPYITIGMIGFVLMIPLAITSNNWSIRHLGPKWRSLHKLVYPAAFLGGLHFVMLAKGLQIEPLIYLAVICGLLALRVPRFSGASRRASAN